MKKPIISVSGLRGIVGESLDPILVQRYVLSFAKLLRPGPVILARDGRESGPMIARSISAALMSAGFDVLDADVCATPTVGVLVRDEQASGGVQISASHNPPEYNGIKLFGPDGRVVSADLGKKVLEGFEKNEFSFVPFNEVGQYELLDETMSAHLHLVLNTVDVEAIRQKNFKVVVDSNHGAGSILARQLLTELNCEFTILGDQPDGQFEHVPEPTAENLKPVAEAAKTFGADVVFCQDPDADRLAIIDEQGRYIGEEYTLAITLKHALQRAESLGFADYERKVVVNCATSRMSVDIAEDHNCECLISSVGEANVTKRMIDSHAVYGGEGNGGPIDPRVGYVRDSFVGMAQVLDAMAAQDKSLSELAAQITPYSIVKSKVQLDNEKIKLAIESVVSHFDPQEVSQDDGLRMDFEDSWLLIRASNTEPIVRVIAEALTTAQAQTLVDKAKSILESAAQ